MENRRLILLMTILAATASRSSRAQEYKSMLWGGSGGTTTYNLDCGSGGVLVGFYGKAGMWLDQLGATCQVVKADGTLGSTYTRGPVGGTGGTSVRSTCAAGKVVGQFVAQAGSYINGIYYQCYKWMPASRRLYWNDLFGSGTLGPVNTTNTSGQTRCPEDKVGKAIRGKAGSYIDSLQFVCDAYNQ